MFECVTPEKEAQEEEVGVKGRCERRSWAYMKKNKVGELKVYDFKNYHIIYLLFIIKPP